ncbi:MULTISPECIES: plastocyanin/azurin family copper-binding protein [unclassified Phenylobacterium]|uniref:cupredoxin domain-containing protein n=1 Tax=unclassified Phenylobacterium TaxID=2640670 RepID=UPI0009E8F8F8|nr:MULTISPECIES: plastocyanin/azurin family copper-binding protein [unclassified Phenylobacterium]
MTTTRRSLLLFGVATAALASAANAAETRRVEISQTKTAFEPAELAIRAGDTVRWRNQGLIEHTVVCDPTKAKNPKHAAYPAGATPFASEPLADGATFEHTFTVPGVYLYFCQEHEAMEMFGKITVT